MNNFGSGLATRLGCIPFPPGEQMMELRKYTPTDLEGDTRLKTWAYRLDKVAGELPLWPIVETAWEWTRDHFLMAKLNDDDKADRMLCLRVSYYGICIAAPFIVMGHWDQWQQDRTLPIDDTDKRLSELIMDIQHACSRYFFYEYAKAYYDKKTRDALAGGRNKRTKTRASYNALPKEFELEDVEKCYGVTHGNATVIVVRLVKEGLVERIAKGKYKKKCTVI